MPPCDVDLAPCSKDLHQTGRQLSDTLGGLDGRVGRNPERSIPAAAAITGEPVKSVRCREGIRGASGDYGVSARETMLIPVERITFHPAKSGRDHLVAARYRQD